MRHLYIIMGPAGCGKSSVAATISQRKNWPMIEADAHHSAENVDKQSRGIPLNDADRAGWIDSILEAVNRDDAEHMVLACSALTPYVQDRLIAELIPSPFWFLLDVSREELARRVGQREDHFMPATLVEDQLAALSVPDAAHRINGEQPIARICAEILDRIE